MGGRGRGRGRGMSINIEALGLGRGEILPTVAQPPPLFPPLMFKPVPLSDNEDLDYMLALKQELRESFHKSPFFIKAPNKVKDIERYSDKYQLGTSDSTANWTPDWTRLPTELRERVKRKKANLTVLPKVKIAKETKDDDVSKLLEKLEENDVKADNPDAEGQEEGDEEKKIEKEDGDDEEEEEVDDEDIEEETDYNLDYFDNGEGYGDDDEDDDEGPTY